MDGPLHSPLGISANLPIRKRVDGCARRVLLTMGERHSDRKNHDGKCRGFAARCQCQHSILARKEVLEMDGEFHNSF